MIRILALTRYDRLGASSRLRTFQYLPRLAANGVEVTVAPLFPDAYVRALQQGRRPLWVVLAAYARRLDWLFQKGRFDALWIEKEVLPWLPAWVEKTLLGRNIPYILDYDDAVFHLYDMNRWGWIRRLLGAKLAALMQGASLITAGNDYLADYARRAGARWVEVLPTVVDLSRYTPKLSHEATTRPVVGWIGQRSTATLLLPLRNIFAHLRESGRARVVAIGIDTEAFDLPMESLPWSESTEVESIRGLDIGVMPLNDAPFERGKCGYKLIQYMACGLPVVASPVGVNCKLVKPGINGFLANTPEEWQEAIERLCSHPDLRQRMGAAGRHQVENEYCLDVAAPRLEAFLRSVVSSSR